MAGGYNHVYIRMLLRQAVAQSTVPQDVPAQIAWLTALQTAIFASISKGDRTLQSSSMNGKSIAFLTSQETTPTEAAKAVETAIEILEAGLPGPVNIAYGRSIK